MTLLRASTHRRSAWAVIIGLGAIQGWFFRHKVSPDGVSYLDLSDAVVHGRFADIVNGYWSPLYPVVVGLLRICVSWTPLGQPYWEFFLLHLASWIGLALSLAAFDWFLQTLDHVGEAWDRRPFASAMNRAMAYALFAVAALVMISVEGTVPDFFLTASVFSSFALAVRITETPNDLKRAVLLGLALAGGALSKSFMFPFSVVLLASLAFALRRNGALVVRPVAVALATFGVATLPWCIALSIHLGRPSTGETGALNFAWYVNGSQPANTGVMPRLATPTALPLQGVGVFAPARGTNPWWFDPAFWNRDIRPQFAPREQWVRLSDGLAYYVGVFSPLIALAIAAAVGVGWTATRATVERMFVVIVPSAAAFGAYALVYTTSRYVAPFLVAACLASIAALPVGARVRPARTFIALAAALLLLDSMSSMRGRVFVAYAAAFFVFAFLAWNGRSAAQRWVLAAATAAIALTLASLLPVTAARILILGTGVAGWFWFSSADRSPERNGAPLRAICVAGLLALIVPNAITAWYAAQRWVATANGQAHPDWSIAQAFISEGIAPGSRIAIVGDATDVGWARLARYQIVGIVPPGLVNAFAGLTERQRQEILASFARVGAAHVVVRPAK
jgi:hypothetical protein